MGGVPSGVTLKPPSPREVDFRKSACAFPERRSEQPGDPHWDTRLNQAIDSLSLACGQPAPSGREPLEKIQQS